MKTLGYVVLICSILWLVLAGLYDLLWLMQPVAVPPRCLWWVMRLPLSRPHTLLGFPVSWPLLAGMTGVMIGSGLSAYADRKTKLLREGSEA
jgi:hypothetical protein